MLVIIVSLVIVFLGVSIWAIIDAASRPSEAFVAVRESKAMWLTLIAVFTLSLFVVGFILALVYLLTIRPKVKNGSSDSLTGQPPVVSRRPWIFFIIWMLVGSAWAMVIVGAFSIGIVFIPVAAIATVFLVRKPASRRGIPGLFGGLALPLFYVAYLNRSGPGMVCATTQSPSGFSESCGSEGNPCIWLLTGLVLLGVGVAIFTFCAHSGEGLQCANCSQPMGPEDQFCSHCGNRSSDFHDVH